MSNKTIKPEGVSGHLIVRSLGYILFIGSVAAYAYTAQYLWTQLIEAAPGDTQIYVYVAALSLCWVGSIYLVWKWFRFYQNYKPGVGSLLVSLIPALILPLAWGALQLIKIAESSF